ncbi:MAG: hypothetical protein Q8M06_00550 [Methanobacteriaceae archaeon]|nr:hypothetical protein [Methanobacteriaceae archaeon]MDZ4170934.1 hypothetical protein [Methanobacteriaceae archaeon]
MRLFTDDECKKELTTYMHNNSFENALKNAKKENSIILYFYQLS